MSTPLLPPSFALVLSPLGGWIKLPVPQAHLFVAYVSQQKGVMH